MIESRRQTGQWRRIAPPPGSTQSTSRLFCPIWNPVMIFVMRLFAPAAMTDDRIPQTNRAVAKDRAPTRFDPIDFEVVLSDLESSHDLRHAPVCAGGHDR